MYIEQSRMTKDVNKCTDYVELVDSSVHKTSLEPPNYSLSSDTLPPSLLLQLTHDLKSSNKTLNMTSSLKDNTLDDTKVHHVNSSLPDSNSRPLPVVKPPYYNVHSEVVKHKENRPLQVNTIGFNKRPSYGEFLGVQTSTERNSYSELNIVLDHYDLLAPVQRLDVPKVNVTNNSQHRPNAASKKCVALSVCCILVALLVVLAAMLASVLHVRDQINHSIDTKLSSLRTFQDEVNSNVLDTLQAMSSSFANASDLRVIYSNSCYCLYKEQRLHWQGAKEFCLAKGKGVHLAEIYTKDENDFLMPILQASTTKLGIWLGGSDLDKEGVWVWNYTGKKIEDFQPRQWADGQPSSISQFGFENCLDVYTWSAPTFKWNDHGCNDLKPFLCQSQQIQSKCLC